MPIVDPIVGSYYLTDLHSGIYDDAGALQCHSTHRFTGTLGIRRVMAGAPSASGYAISDARNKVLAFILFRSHPEERKMNLIDLVVHPDHQRKGLGTMLVRRMMVGRDFDAILTPVRESNLLGQKFLQKNGFLAYRVRHDYFKDHWAEGPEKEDAYYFVYSEHQHIIDQAMEITA